jgi:hypothetical protein
VQHSGPFIKHFRARILAGQLPSSTPLNLSLTVMSNNKNIINLVLVYSTAWCHTVAERFLLSFTVFKVTITP